MKAGLELTSCTVCWSLLRHLPRTGGIDPGLKLGSCTGDTTLRFTLEYGAQAICPEASVVSTVVAMVSAVVGTVVVTGS